MPADDEGEVAPCLTERPADPGGKTVVDDLARYVDGYIGLQPVLEALEEQMVLLRLLGETRAETVTVTIGHENVVEGMSATSVGSAGYGPGHGTLARLGVVGPTHMDYPSTMASVRAVARYLGQLLANE